MYHFRLLLSSATVNAAPADVPAIKILTLLAYNLLTDCEWCMRSLFRSYFFFLIFFIFLFLTFSHFPDIICATIRWLLPLLLLLLFEMHATSVIVLHKNTAPAMKSCRKTKNNNNNNKNAINKVKYSYYSQEFQCIVHRTNLHEPEHHNINSKLKSAVHNLCWLIDYIRGFCLHI